MTDPALREQLQQALAQARASASVWYPNGSWIPLLERLVVAIERHDHQWDAMGQALGELSREIEQVRLHRGALANAVVRAADHAIAVYAVTTVPAVPKRSR